MTERSKVLLVEDELELLETMRDYLRFEFEIFTAPSLREAREVVQAEPQIKLCVLDVNLPDGTGFEFCEELMKNDSTKDIAVMFFTARGGKEERLRGLKLGADDYITKPVEFEELKLRIRSRINRIEQAHSAGGTVIEVGNVELNLTNQEAFVLQRNQKKRMNLTPTEFKILVFMANHVGNKVTRDEIADAVWGDESGRVNRTVDAHISKLRKKLKDSTHLIRPLYGTGYRFEKVMVPKRSRLKRAA